ncbi:hypothetical protein Poli38472_013756 [Pythium oligandrum]|uniref:Transmembrane protein 267 n=1 Tax=Pythium oligandrum TaxID=41045 RepID=A0A8K1CE15_PYTOL|nr:hypothetical protein Poli38472_013756 [Pythium oligandrum]|eukprot:TMW61293.1 hypothetical protein Poli38472_013756 [Pythium oligandrum]
MAMEAQTLLDVPVDDTASSAKDAAPTRAMTLSERLKQCTMCSALSPRGWMQRVLIVALLVVCLVGDFFLYQQVLMASWKLFRHLVDSAAHGSVGFCAWGIFLCFSHDRRIPPADRLSATPLPVFNDDAETSAPASSTLSWRDWRAFLTSCLLAGVTAALLDLDHFIAAGSFSIDGATHLKGRPFGHAVTFILAVVLLVWAYSCHKRANKWTIVHRVSFVVTTLLSHQLRDGMRLGLWFWPIGSTPPIFYLLYLLMEVGLPIVLAKWQLMHVHEGVGRESHAPRTNRPSDDEIVVDVREEHTTPAQTTTL